MFLSCLLYGDTHDERCTSVKREADRRRNPGYIRACSIAKDKHARWREGRSENSGYKAVFRLADAVLQGVRLVDEVYESTVDDECAIEQVSMIEYYQNFLEPT